MLLNLGIGEKGALKLTVLQLLDTYDIKLRQCVEYAIVRD